MNFGKLKHVVSYWLKNILKLGSHIEMGATWCTTQNQVLSFFMTKCIEDFEVTLCSHLAHPFIIAHI